MLKVVNIFVKIGKEIENFIYIWEIVSNVFWLEFRVVIMKVKGLSLNGSKILVIILVFYCIIELIEDKYYVRVLRRWLFF